MSEFGQHSAMASCEIFVLGLHSPSSKSKYSVLSHFIHSSRSGCRYAPSGQGIHAPLES